MLARSSGDDPEAVAAAAAVTLVSFARDPAGLVVACRRLVDHHRDAAAMWWVAARLLGSNDPADVAGDCARYLERSPSLERLVERLPFPAEQPVGVIDASDALRDCVRSRPDIEVVDLGGTRPRATTRDSSHVLVEVQATDGTTARLTESASAFLRRDSVQPVVWAVVRGGRHLPEMLFRAFCTAERASGDDNAATTTIPLRSFDAVVGPGGCGEPERVLGQPLCGAPPELLRPFA